MFPSGHVAVAFSSAFGMLRALPEVRWAGIGLTVYASLVFLATIYGRYHYAGDGVGEPGAELRRMAPEPPIQKQLSRGQVGERQLVLQPGSLRGGWVGESRFELGRLAPMPRV